MPEYVVSACLAGHLCRYDGGSNPCPAVMELVRRGRALPLCPEGLAELPVPRPPCELQCGRAGGHSAAAQEYGQKYGEECGQECGHEEAGHGERGQDACGAQFTPLAPGERVMGKDGHDRSAAFARGARLALEATLAHGCTRAILKARSPSCGSNGIYDGTFSKKLVPGMGLWARLLVAHGVEVFSEEDLPASLASFPKA